MVIVVTKHAHHDVLLFDRHNLKLITVSHAGYELVPTSDPPFLGPPDAFKIPTKTPNTTLLPIALAIQLVPTLAHARAPSSSFVFSPKGSPLILRAT